MAGTSLEQKHSARADTDTVSLPRAIALDLLAAVESSYEAAWATFGDADFDALGRPLQRVLATLRAAVRGQALPVVAS